MVRAPYKLCRIANRIQWVDDLLIATSDQILMNDVKLCFHNKFKMKDLGPLSWFLGNEFIRDSSSIQMKQERYIEKVLSRFNMNDCKPKSIPITM